MKRRDFLQLLGVGAVVASCGPCKSAVDARPKPPRILPASYRGKEFLIARGPALDRLHQRWERDFMGTEVIYVKPNSVVYPSGRGDRLL